MWERERENAAARPQTVYKFGKSQTDTRQTVPVLRKGHTFPIRMSFQCVSCSSKFTRKRNLNKHFAQKHSGVNRKNIVSCFLCGKTFSDYESLNKHHNSAHKSSSFFELRQSAFSKSATIYRHIFNDNMLASSTDSLSPFLINEVLKVLTHESAKKNYLKFSSVFIAQMSMQDHQNSVISKATIPFRSKAYVCIPLQTQKIRRNVANAFNSHHEHIENFINNGSNWVFDRPIALDLEIVSMSPLLAGSTNAPIILKDVPNVHSLVDVPSKDEKCFLYCVAWFITKSKKTQELENIVNSFDISGMRFPVSIGDIRKFVRQNKNLNLCINIFFVQNRQVFPFKTGIGRGTLAANLLMLPISQPKNVHPNSNNHFLAIKNLDRFLSKTYIKNGKKSFNFKFYCSKCVKSFSSKSKRDEHAKDCEHTGEIVEIAPTPGKDTISFYKHENKFKRDLVGYLDFECELGKMENKCETCHTVRCKCDKSYTRNEQEHRPICFSFVLLNKFGELLAEKYYIGNEAADEFVRYLLEIEKAWIRTYLNTTVSMNNLSTIESLSFGRAQKCYMCEKAFTSEDYKVRDHDHSDGAYLGAAHNSCNLRRRRQNKVNIYVHNGSSYDFHFLVKALFKRKLELYILPHNSEKFRMIKFNSFILLDSLAFLQASLSQLADDLLKSGHDYKIIKQSTITQSGGLFDIEKFRMLLQKGYFCYDYW